MDTSHDEELLKDLMFNLELLQREEKKIDDKLNPLRAQLADKTQQLNYEKEKLAVAKRRKDQEEITRRENSIQAVNRHIERLTEDSAELEAAKKSSVEKLARMRDEIRECGGI